MGGGTQTFGMPAGPQGPQWKANAAEQPSYDTSRMWQLRNAQAQKMGQNQINQAMAGLTAQGGGRSSNMAQRRMAMAGALGQNQLQTGAELGLQGWRDQLQQMLAQNQFNLQKYGQDIEQYKNQAALAQAQAQQRANAAGALGPMGNILGAASLLL